MCFPGYGGQRGGFGGGGGSCTAGEATGVAREPRRQSGRAKRRRPPHHPRGSPGGSLGEPSGGGRTIISLISQGWRSAPSRRSPTPSCDLPRAPRVTRIIVSEGVSEAEEGCRSSRRRRPTRGTLTQTRWEVSGRLLLTAGVTVSGSAASCSLLSQREAPFHDESPDLSPREVIRMRRGRGTISVTDTFSHRLFYRWAFGGPSGGLRRAFGGPLGDGPRRWSVVVPEVPAEGPAEGPRSGRRCAGREGT